VSAATDLCPIDSHKLTLIGPFVGPYNQSGTNRILAHLFPFLAVTLFVAQDVIEKARLPKRSFLGCSGRD
jgi:hypothetical protein